MQIKTENITEVLILNILAAPCVRAVPSTSTGQLPTAKLHSACKCLQDQNGQVSSKVPLLLPDFSFSNFNSF